MPRQFAKLNKHGVPLIPLAIAIGLPSIVLICCPDFNALAGLYAIGVVGAISLNLGCCCFNRWRRHWRRCSRWLPWVSWWRESNDDD